MKRFLTILVSSLTVIGVALRITDSAWQFSSPRSVMAAGLFAAVCLGWNYIAAVSDRRKIVYSAIPSAILSLCHLFGTVLTKKDSALWLLKDIRTILADVLHFCAYGIILFILIFSIFNQLTKQNNTEKKHRKTLPAGILWVVLIIAWVPWLLYQFPAIMTADSTDHVEMALGIDPLTDHHPVFYTMVIKGFMKLGELISKNAPYQTGTGIFSITQFLLMTFCIAITIKMVIPAQWFYAIFALYLVYPVNPLYSVTMWKDVPFAVSLLFLTALFIREMTEHKPKYCIGIAISGFFLTIFRHNGLYLILLSLPFIPIAFKHKWKPVFAAMLTVIMLAFGWKCLLLPAMHIPLGEPSEAFSLPLQQIALTAKRHSQQMDIEFSEELTKWFGTEEIGSHYSYRISDPVKIRFNDEEYNTDSGSFWKFWMKFGLEYPQDYLDAILLHTYGYWYPETPHWVFPTGIDDNGIFGIHMDPKIHAGWLDSLMNWLTESRYDEIPLVSLFFSPGACFWVCLIAFCYCLYRKSPAFFLFIPLFILWLTALASPVNCEYRYVYGMFLCLPLILSAIIMDTHH